ncbi:MAG: A/G-specific adenine glycosylase [Cyclobacteriaceae bacterium]|nr:A/G-specific adenine glycosylase [Cyclobacteriaceae bacterium]
MSLKNSFSNLILSWFYKNLRNLPWRNSRNPYQIWLSEIILQQTRVNQGLPYFEKFLNQYPHIEDLAAAPEEEILRLWQGLGYYSRARNLHKCSKIITDKYQGYFPEHYSSLIELPGIGPYTAAAIASIAFDEPVPVIDGNVLRVCSRYLGIREEITSPSASHKIREFLNAEIDRNQPGNFNQAVMELGALVCKPGKPECLLCPLHTNCVGYNSGIASELPVKKSKNERKSRFFNYLILKCGNSYYLQQRNRNDIWKGLYEFFLIESDRLYSGNSLPDIKNLPVKIGNCIYESEINRHVLTHQNIIAKFFIIECAQTEGIDQSDNVWFLPQQIERLPKPILIDRFFQENLF